MDKKEDELYVDVSDDEKYNPTGEERGTWMPDPKDILEIFDILSKEKVLKLNWKCPGRRAPKRHIEEEAMEVEHEPLRETAGESKEKPKEPIMSTEFDFADDVSIERQPMRTPGKTPKTQKRVACMEKILDDIMKQRKENQHNLPAKSAAGINKGYIFTSQNKTPPLKSNQSPVIRPVSRNLLTHHGPALSSSTPQKGLSYSQSNISAGKVGPQSLTAENSSTNNFVASNQQMQSQPLAGLPSRNVETTAPLVHSAAALSAAIPAISRAAYIASQQTWLSYQSNKSSHLQFTPRSKSPVRQGFGDSPKSKDQPVAQTSECTPISVYTPRPNRPIDSPIRPQQKVSINHSYQASSEHSQLNSSGVRADTTVQSIYSTAALSNPLHPTEPTPIRNETMKNYLSPSYAPRSSSVMKSTASKSNSQPSFPLRRTSLTSPNETKPLFDSKLLPGRIPGQLREPESQIRTPLQQRRSPDNKITPLQMPPVVASLDHTSLKFQHAASIEPPANSSVLTTTPKHTSSNTPDAKHSDQSQNLLTNSPISAQRSAGGQITQRSPVSQPIGIKSPITPQTVYESSPNQKTGTGTPTGLSPKSQSKYSSAYSSPSPRKSSTSPRAETRPETIETHRVIQTGPLSIAIKATSIRDPPTTKNSQ